VRSAAEIALIDGDGLAHRIYREVGQPPVTEGLRVRIHCWEKGTLPLDVFDLRPAWFCSPAMRCQGCFLAPCVTICMQCDVWGCAGETCPFCGRTEPTPQELAQQKLLRDKQAASWSGTWSGWPTELPYKITPELGIISNDSIWTR